MKAWQAQNEGAVQQAQAQESMATAARIKNMTPAEIGEKEAAKEMAESESAKNAAETGVTGVTAATGALEAEREPSPFTSKRAAQYIHARVTSTMAKGDMCRSKHAQRPCD